MQNSALRGSVWTMSYAITSLPLNIAVNIAVARLLGPVEYGVLATLTAAFTIGIAVINAGVSDATVQWGAGYDAAGRRPALLDVVRRCAGYHVVVQAPVSVGLVVFVLRGAELPVVLVSAVAIVLVMVFGTSAVAQVAVNRTANAAQIAMATNVATQVAVLFAALVAHSGDVVWAARLVVGVVPAVATILLIPSDLRRAVLRPRWPVRWPAGFGRFAVTSWASVLVATALFSRSEVFVLQYYGMAEAAGVFALAFGLSYQLTAGVDALVNPLAPAAAGLFAVDRASAAAGVLRALRLMCVATSVVLAVAIPLVAVLIPTIYSSEFSGATSLFAPLAIASCFQSVTAVLMTFVVAARRVGSVLLVNLAAFIVDVALAIALVPPLGALGATLANVAAQLIAIVGCWVILRRTVDVTAAQLRTPATQLVRGTAVGLGVTLVVLEVGAGAPAVLTAAVASAAGLLLLRVTTVLVGPPPLEDGDVALLMAFPPARLRPWVGRGLRWSGVVASVQLERAVARA